MWCTDKFNGRAAIAGPDLRTDAFRSRKPSFLTANTSVHCCRLSPEVASDT